MKIPPQIVVATSEYLHIQTKINCYIAKYGCRAVSAYLDLIPIRMRKKDNKHLGAYIVNKVCQEFEVSQYELFESGGRNALSDARKVFCTLVDRYLDMSQEEISGQFGRTRHFAKRLIGSMHDILKENHPIDSAIIARFKKLDALISAYVGFQPKYKSK